MLSYFYAKQYVNNKLVIKPALCLFRFDFLMFIIGKDSLTLDIQEAWSLGCKSGQEMKQECLDNIFPTLKITS